MNIIQCSICRRPAAWMIGGDIFCEGHKEAIIEEFGVDHFLIRRLTTVDRTFQAAGHFSMFRRTKKLVRKKRSKENEGGSRALQEIKAMAKILQLQAESSIVSIPLSLAMYCENCNTISNSAAFAVASAEAAPCCSSNRSLTRIRIPRTGPQTGCGSLTCARSAPNYCAPAVIQKDVGATSSMCEAI